MNHSPPEKGEDTEDGKDVAHSQTEIETKSAGGEENGQENEGVIESETSEGQGGKGKEVSPKDSRDCDSVGSECDDSTLVFTDAEGNLSSGVHNRNKMTATIGLVVHAAGKWFYYY